MAISMHDKFTGLVQTCFNKLGYQITKLDKSTKLVSQLNLVALYWHLLERDPNDTFVVQIGANDGQHDDPLRAMIKSLSLKCLLIEPNPEVFRRLKENYADINNGQISFENVALDYAEGFRTLYVPSNGMDWLASFDRNHLIWHGIGDSEIESIEVETISPNALLRRNGLNDPDIVMIDTEGFDAQVVQMIISDGWRPSIIQFERKHILAGDMNTVRSLLWESGYALQDTSTDCFAIKLSCVPKLGILDEDSTQIEDAKSFDHSIRAV